MTEIRDPDDVAGLAIDDAWWPRPSRPGAPFRHTVGARTVEPDAWLRPRPHDAALVAWKAGVLDTAGPLAFRALPGTQPSGAETLAVVAAAAGAAEAAGRRGDPAASRHPLDEASRLVAEDLCLLDVTGPVPVLTAGSVAMPSRWVLADKLGRDLLGVHQPVPGYAEEIGTPTDRLVLRLADGRVLARTAWTLTDQPALFQPSVTSRIGTARPDVRSAVDAARCLFVRVEYQTVRALPASGAVLFTIRTAREPLGAVDARPERASALLSVIESMPAEQLDYKGVAPYRDHVVAYLRGVA